MDLPRARRALVLVLALVTLSFAVPAFLPSAVAAPALTGHLDRVGRTTTLLALRGWAVDPADSARSLDVHIYIDGKLVAGAHANLARSDVNRAMRVHGRHGFAITIRRPRGANHVQVFAINKARRTTGLLPGSVYLIRAPQQPSLSARIIAEARRYLGAPYVSGGASPAGFDCSGYTMYVYARVHAARLAHNSETQRHQVRLISRAAARPGDLIFYMSGGVAFHVAINAGNGYQYVAPAPGQRVKLEHIWSSALQFGTKRY